MAINDTENDILSKSDSINAILNIFHREEQ